MQKSDLQIEPYTLNEALICLNKELKKVNRKQIKIRTLYDYIYNKFKIETINKPKNPTLIEYNNIVELFTQITTKRYPKNRQHHAN